MNDKNEVRTIDVVITHKNCPDGSGSALVALKYCKETKQKTPKVYFVQYGDEVPDIRDKHVMMCDFSYKKDIITQMFKDTKSLVILDHHKTAMDDLMDFKFVKELNNPLDKIVFDMKKSGAMLTWDFLYPNQEAPDIIKYIQDRDLWLWKEKESKEFSAGFSLWTQRDLLLVVSLQEIFEPKFLTDTIAEGESILKYQNSIILKSLKKISSDSIMKIYGFKCNRANSTHLISELGNAYAGLDSVDFSLQYFYTDTEILFSLRSIGDFDVSGIARSFNGGGHKNAAGFSFKIDEFDHQAFFTKGIIRKRTLWNTVKSILKFK